MLAGGIVKLDAQVEEAQVVVEGALSLEQARGT